MTRRVLKIWRIGPALLALACLLALLAPGALAAEAVDKSTDGVEIGEDGTVTLISGHIGGEQVASVQFQLTLSEGDSFTLDPAFAAAGKITYVTGTDTVSVYIAGPTALMGPDQTSLVLGTVTDPAGAAMVEGSLKYVYGKTVVQQSASSFRQAGPGDEASYREQIQSLLSGEKNQDDYTPESYAEYVAAADAASRLSADVSAGAEQLQEAFSALQEAINNLTRKGLGSLRSLLETARDALAKAEAAPESYTAESVAALRDAVAKAEEAMSKDSEEEWTAAAEALGKVINPVPVGARNSAPYDPGGPNVSSDAPGTGAPGGTAGAETAKQAAPAGNTAPNTGDEAAPLPWTLALLGSLGMLAALAAARRRLRGR